MNKHEKIDYVEFPAKDLIQAKDFFSKVFSWSFTDYGEDYLAFSDGVLNGGFYRADARSSVMDGAALVVFYTENLEQTQSKILAAGGKIVKPVFSFPGGRRFHFTDPNGNEFAVWSDH